LTVNVKVNVKLCSYCMDCVECCSGGALSYDNAFHHNPDLCSYCECCADVCGEEAITIREV